MEGANRAVRWDGCRRSHPVVRLVVRMVVRSVVRLVAGRGGYLPRVVRAYARRRPQEC
jgi:hypothetical protein